MDPAAGIIDSPLGQTAIGVALFAVLSGIFWTVRWYFLNIVYPKSKQELQIQRELADNSLATQDRIAEATEAMSRCVSAINRNLSFHSEELKEIRRTQAEHSRVQSEHSRKLDEIEKAILLSHHSGHSGGN